MRRKIKALLTALIVFAQCTISTSFATENQSWEIKRYGDANIDDANYYGKITDDSKYDGDYSLNVRCYVSKVTEGNYIEAKNNLNGNLSNGTYNLTFYSKLTGSMSPTSVVSVFGTDYMMSAVEAEDVTAPSGEAGWKKYSMQVEYDDESTNDISFRFFSKLHNQWIDNVSLKKVGEDKEYIIDGDFEEYNPPAEKYDSTPYRAVNLMKSPAGSGALALSWINPTSTTLKTVKLYDVTGENEILLTDTLSATPGKMVYQKISELDDNVCYRYRLEFDFSDVDTVIYYIDAAASNETEFTVGSWQIRKWKGGSAGFTPADAYVDTTEKNTGEASLKIVSNIDGNQSGFSSNIYLMLYYQGLGLSAGTKYKISFWSKCKNAKGDVSVHMNFNADNRMTKITGDSFTQDNDWTYNEYTYESKGNQFFGMSFPRLAEAIWLDDFEAYELDEDGIAVGKNLFGDIGGFEGLVTGTVAKLSGLSAETSSRSAELSWQTGSGNISGIRVYQKLYEDYFEYRGDLSAEATSLKLTGLNNGSEYTFRLVPYNANGKEGTEKDVTFTLSIPDYEVIDIGTDMSRNDSGEVQAGNYTVTSHVKNNGIDGGLPYEQIVAVYKDSMLIGVYSTEATILKTSGKADPTAVKTQFGVPEAGKYSVKIFTMDNRDDLTLYHTPVQY